MRTIAALTVCALAAAASADTTNFIAFIDGAQDNTMSPATGVLTGVYDSDANTFSFEWEITDNLLGVPDAPGAHIHRGAPGVAGPIAFAFASGPWDLAGAAVWENLTATDVDELLAGDLYVNFHTSSFPGGEVRGQITKIPTPGAAALLGLGFLSAARRRR